jgi:plastocyanin
VAVRSAGALAGALVLLAAAAPGARAATQPVGIQFAAFGPSLLDALPGDTIAWENLSPRSHTVVSDAGAFASGELTTGDRFSFTPENVGAFAYHCSIHPSMTGEIDVRHVTLGPLPPAALAPGTRVELTGRTDDPSQPVRIERDGSRAVTTVTPSRGGDWRAAIRATQSADYRAVTGAGESETRRLLVNRRVVHVRATRTGIAVRVTPSDPGGRILLQVRRRERFGWWPLARKRLDFLSEAVFRVPGGGRVRALLVDRDDWTPLATSRVTVLSRHRASPTGSG